MAKLTFFCPCYNHEDYVIDFLNSLLAQTNPDWELIIIDDCSADSSVKKIKSVKDKRIHLVQNIYNKGINANVSTGIQKAQSEILSFVASDDILYPDYVDTMLSTFKENPDISAVYTPLKHMNQAGELLDTTTSLPTDKTETKIFADMFIGENLLPSPGMAFKKEVMEPHLPLDMGLIQYSDYQMHFFVLFQHKIKMLEKPLVQYRISHKGACARSHTTTLREDIETKKLMDTVIDLIGKDKDLFNQFFGNHPLIKNKEIPTETIPYWLGRLALTSTNQAKQKWGLQTIMNFISAQENMFLLNKLYGFSYKEYMQMAGEIKSVLEYSNIERKVKKYKKKAKRLIHLLIILLILYTVLIGVLICK